MNHVRVDNRIRTEDEAAEERVNQVYGTVEGKEDGDDASHRYQ
jgi:hypothetical protein